MLYPAGSSRVGQVRGVGFIVVIKAIDQVLGVVAQSSRGFRSDVDDIILSWIVNGIPRRLERFFQY